MKHNRASVPYLPKQDAGYRSANDEDDPYRMASKPPEPTRCPECNATYVEGRWSWQAAPEDAYEQLCPACQRIQDRFPAGFVNIKGAFFQEHRDEIMHLINNKAEKEKEQRPLQRIMEITDTPDGVQVTTTDSHLARGIAEALQAAYKGDLKLRYSRDENLVRASWSR